MTHREGTGVALESLREGDELPGIDMPITLQRLVMEAGANRDLSLIHHDNAVAQTTGAPAAFANTYFLMGMFERRMREWAGPGVRIRKIGPLRMLVFNAVGDVVTFAGRVSAVDTDAREVALEMWAESARGRTVTCEAVITFPV